MLICASAGGPPKQAPSKGQLGRERELVHQLASLESKAVVHLCFAPDLASVQTRAAHGDIVQTPGPAPADAAPGAAAVPAGGRQNVEAREQVREVSAESGTVGNRGSRRLSSVDIDEAEAAARRQHLQQKQARNGEGGAAGGGRRMGDDEQLSTPDWDDWGSGSNRVKASKFGEESPSLEPQPVLAAPQGTQSEKMEQRELEVEADENADARGIDWDDWDSPKMRHKASAHPIHEEPRVVSTRAMEPIAPPAQHNHQNQRQPAQQFEHSPTHNHHSQSHHEQASHHHLHHQHQQPHQQHLHHPNHAGGGREAGEDPLRRLKRTIDVRLLACVRLIKHHDSVRLL